MACLGTLVPGQVFLVLKGFANSVVSALWVLSDVLCWSVPTYCPLGTSLRVLSCVSTMLQFFWHNDLLKVFKFLCESLDVMLGADCDGQSQTSDQP